MALKDIWQQDRQTRQAEVVERSRTVAELRSQHQREHAEMATQLRDQLSQVAPKLRADELDRQLEAQCDQAGREIEASARRQEVQEFLNELHELRLIAAADLRLLLEEFRCDRKAQSAEVSAMLKETRRQRSAEVEALFVQFASDTIDRKAAVQAIRDYVWGDASSTAGSRSIAPQATGIQATGIQAVGIQAVGSESIEDFLKLVIQESPVPAKTPIVKMPIEPVAKAIIKPIAEPIDAVSTLSEKLLATVNSLSGVRLSDLEATLAVSRSELVQALQQLIRSGDIVQRDRAYYRA